MQLEWNKWLTGLTSFKQEQGMLWVFCVVLLCFLHRRCSGKKQSLFVFFACMGMLIICPITAVILLKGYTPFYDWLDLQLLFPTTFLLGYGATALVQRLSESDIPGMDWKKNRKNLLAWCCVLVLLFAGTTFHSFDSRSKADENGVPVEVAQVFKPIHDLVGDHSLVLAAPSKILLYTRLYEEEWIPLYGRDLWSPKAASYINSAYEIEYQYYKLLEKEYLEQEEFTRLSELIRTGPAECVIVPAGWISEIGTLKDCVLVDISDLYTGIMKKDLRTK